MRIRELLIYSPNLADQVRFYRDLLGFSARDQRSDSVSFTAGHTVFTLVQDQAATPYHIAFNIPAGKAHQALDWLRERVPVLVDDGQELVRFDAWNALAMYFYDADRNIIEFIARRDIPDDPEGSFSAEQILGISEVGVPVTDIRQAWTAISRIGTLPVYDGNFEKFCAAGDPEGLLILINRDRKTWFPTNDKAFSSPFSIRGDLDLDFRDGQILPAG